MLSIPSRLLMPQVRNWMRRICWNKSKISSILLLPLMIWRQGTDEVFPHIPNPCRRVIWSICIVLVGMALTTEECTMFIRTLQSSLKGISQERIAAGYITPESRLGNQAWYSGTCQALKLQAEVLRTLFLAINLLHHKNNADENGKLSAEARLFSSHGEHYPFANRGCPFANGLVPSRTD